MKENLQVQTTTKASRTPQNLNNCSKCEVHRKTRQHMRLPKICLKYFFKLPPAVFVTNLDPGDSQVRRLQERPWERG